MKKPNQFLKRAGRVVAGVNVLFNLSSTPKPPDLQVPGRTQELQSQWAKNEKSHVLPSWRNRARELGYQLREPVSGEYRPREDLAGKDSSSGLGKAATGRDSHEQALSGRPARARSREGQSRGGQGRGGQGR